MVTKFVPLPDNDGGKQRALAVARRLARRADVVLCAYDDGDGDVAGLKRLGHRRAQRPVAADARRAPRRGRAADPQRLGGPVLQRRARRRGAPGRGRGPGRPAPGGVPPDGAAWRAASPPRRRVPRPAQRGVGPGAQLRPGRARAPPGLVAHAEAAALGAMERALVPSLRHRRGGERARAPAPARRASATSSSAPTAGTPTRSGRPPPAPTPTAAFVATMGWAPNVDAARVVRARGVARGAPPLARRPPPARGPGPRPRRCGPLQSSSVEVSGTVSDVRPYLAQARVAVAPLRSGGGTRLKILEALDAGRPVVATSVAVDGLEDLIGEGVVVADDAGVDDRRGERPARRPRPGRRARPGRPRRRGGPPHLGRGPRPAARRAWRRDRQADPPRRGGAWRSGMLLYLFLRWERSGREHWVVFLLLGMLVVESTLYDNQTTIPQGLFHPGTGSLEFRLPEVIITVALVARLLIKGTPKRIGLPALLWLAVAAWWALEAVEGVLRHNSTGEAPLRGQGDHLRRWPPTPWRRACPIRRYLEGRGFERLLRWSALSASVLLAPRRGAQGRYAFNIPLLRLTDFGVAGHRRGDDLRLRRGRSASCSSWPRNGAAGSTCCARVPLALSPFFAYQRAVLLTLGGRRDRGRRGGHGVHGPRAAADPVRGGRRGRPGRRGRGARRVGHPRHHRRRNRSPGPSPPPINSTLGATLNSEAKQESAQDRLNKWSVALADAKQHWLLGQGLGIRVQLFPSRGRINSSRPT